MKIIEADETRIIDLPGVGPCPRPVDIDQSVTGFARLKSLRIYRFAPGVAIKGESEGDEVWIVPLGGAVRMEISGAQTLDTVLGPAGPRALYMAPGQGYRLTPQAPVQVAYGRAEAAGQVATHVAGSTQGERGEALLFALVDLDDARSLAMDPGRERLIHVVAGALDADDMRIGPAQTLALAAGEAVAVHAFGATSVLMMDV